MPPKPGMMPEVDLRLTEDRRLAGEAHVALIESSQPPPNAPPLTAAIVVRRPVSSLRKIALVASIALPTSSGVVAARMP